MRLGGKFTIGRKGYWIATAALLAIQWFGSKSLGAAPLAPWIMLYLARLRDAGRSAVHLLHLAVIVVLIFIPVFVAPDAYGAYMADVPPAQTPSTRDTIVFLVCIVGAIIDYLAFSIWLGWIKTASRATAPEIADHFT